VGKADAKSVLAAAREGALDILGLHLAKQEHSRARRAAFKKAPPRTGDSFPLFSDEYFAFALLQAIDSTAAAEVERRIRAHYLLNAAGYAGWEAQTDSSVLLAEGVRLTQLIDGMTYEEKNNIPENELLDETRVGLTIRGRLIEMRAKIGSKCLRSF
jgi:hypothetical protein